MFSAHIITRSKLAHCCEWPWYPLMCTWSSWPRFERPPFLCPALLASSWGGGSYISLPQIQPMASSGQLLPQMSSSSLTTPLPCLPWEPVKNTAGETVFRFLEIWTSCWNLVHCPPGIATGFFQLLTWHVCVSYWSEPCACQDYFQVDSKGGLAGDQGPGCLKWSFKTSLSPFPGIH